MKKLLLIIIAAVCCTLLANAQTTVTTPPSDEIWYTTSTNSKVEPYSSDVFGASLLSNTYDETAQRWVMKFDGPVTGIGGEAFLNCQNITSITLPYSVMSIGDKAFYECSGLRSITIPNSVTEIGNYAFSSCTNLTSVKTGLELKHIGNDAFIDCSKLETMVCFSFKSPTIGTDAFSNVSPSFQLRVRDTDNYNDWSTFATICSLTTDDFDFLKAETIAELTDKVKNVDLSEGEEEFGKHLYMIKNINNDINRFSLYRLQVLALIGRCTVYGALQDERQSEYLRGLVEEDITEMYEYVIVDGSETEINKIRDKALEKIKTVLPMYKDIKQDILGKKEDGHCIEVERGEQVLRFYNPDKVSFKKITTSK